MLTASVVTKAGVPTNKIVVGVSSYGRSFGMSDPSCTGPMCTFTGTNIDSTAGKGECTDTPGYISDAEINKMINDPAITTYSYFDTDSNSDILVYTSSNAGSLTTRDSVESSTWVAYLSAANKQSRVNSYRDMGFLGSIDWAVDLQVFTGDDGEKLKDDNDPILNATTTWLHIQGCSLAQTSQLYYDMVDMAKMANAAASHVGIDPDWDNDVALIDYFGPHMPGEPYVDDYISSVYYNLRSYGPERFYVPGKPEIKMFCFDPRVSTEPNAVSCKNQGTKAFEFNRNKDNPGETDDTQNGVPYIVLCDSYWNMKQLDYIVDQTSGSRDIEIKYNMFLYANTGKR